MSKEAKLKLVLIVLAGCGGGCSDAPESPPDSGSHAENQPAGTGQPVREAAADPAAPAQAPLPSISLDAGRRDNTSSSSGPDEQQRRRALIDAMQPLQVMLGSWKGTTQREFGDFKALDEPEWVWDFQSDPDQPALVMSSQASPYFRRLQLTYLTDVAEYQLTVEGPEGTSRSLRGRFSQPVEEFQGEDKRLHRRYKLQLTEQDAADPRDAWQIVLNQQENNRYLVELSRQRGTRYMRFDTVANQRQGTSFALDDADYGEQACIITGGLGTSTVTWQGKTYWVCCSGCRAAFEDDPEKWIAAAAALEQAK